MHVLMIYLEIFKYWRMLFDGYSFKHRVHILFYPFICEIGLPDIVKLNVLTRYVRYLVG